MSSEVQLDDELDRLYQLPPGDFVAARDELSKRLRAADLREEADRVKQLRRPTVAVWLVNRLARERELDVQRLAKVGEELGRTQRTLSAGGDAHDFAEARRDEQRALDQLARAAKELAAREGIGAPAAQRATETLRAASLSEEGRELLKRGRLTEELEPQGFEALTGLATAPRRTTRPQRKTRTKDDRAEREQALKAAREHVRQAQTAERGLAKAAQAARRKATQAQERAAELGLEADEAEAAAAAAAKDVRAAESELERLSR